MVNLLWAKPIRSVSSAPHVRLRRVSVAVWLVSHQTNPMSKGGLYRRKGKKLEGLVASALLWRASCAPPAGLVCPAGGLSFDVVVSPGGGFFFGLVCPWAPPGGGGAAAWRRPGVAVARLSRGGVCIWLGGGKGGGGGGGREGEGGGRVEEMGGRVGVCRCDGI